MSDRNTHARLIHADHGLGILLAASLSILALQRILQCSAIEADKFKETARSDLVALQAAIQSVKARGLSS